jgi:MFS transporter, ACS family, tartrate transporter
VHSVTAPIDRWLCLHALRAALLCCDLFNRGDVDQATLESETIRKVSLRLLPFLFLLYVLNFLDRSNVALAALQMNRDLSFSSSAFGFGAGIFFLGYAIFEVPSNLALSRFGARRWIARIMISWGIIACAMMLVRTPMQFYVLRFLLGVAEAGAFPGIVYYLTQWFPTEHRARASSKFMIALPVSGILGGLIAGPLLALDGTRGLAGWQWLFLLEGLPSVVIGFTVLWYLTDRPSEAKWLTDAQRDWLMRRMEADQLLSHGSHDMPALHALKQPVIWLLALPYFFMLTAGYAYTFWAPTVISDSLKTTDTQTGFVTAAIAVVSMTFMLLHARSSDRNKERFYHAALAGGLIAVGFTGAALAPSPIIRVMSLGLVLIGCNSMLAPFWCIAPMLLSGSAAAVGIALINSLGNTGGFVGPYVIGYVKDATGGTKGSFLALALFGVASSVCMLLLRTRALGPAARSRAIVVPEVTTT